MGPESIDYVGLAQQATSQPEAFGDLAQPLRIALMMAAFAFLTAGLVCVSAFTRIVIVLSFVRRALSTQEIPPNPVVIGLAMFLTIFVMGDTLDQIATDAVQPLLQKEDGMNSQLALRIGMDKLHQFMMHNTRKDDLLVMIRIADEERPATASETPMRLLKSGLYDQRNQDRFHHGFLHFRSLPDGRLGRVHRPDVVGHDDDAAGDGLLAAEAVVVRIGGWLAAGSLWPQRQLRMNFSRRVPT